MRSRVKVSTLVAAVVGLLMIPATAFAYAPAGDDFLTCAAGDDLNVECVAGIFDPGTDVDVLVEVNPVLLDTTVTADADGEIAFNFDVPADQADGDVTVELTGTKNGETVVLSDAFTIVDAGETTDGEVTDGELADTGSNAGLLAIGVFGAFALGGAALFATRRKRTETVA